MKINHFSYQLPDGVSLYEDLTADFDMDKVNVILGPNGEGKTTLLDFITGLKPRSSENFIDFPAMKDIAYQIQGVPFIGEATVFNTMKMVLDIEGHKPSLTHKDLPPELIKIADRRFHELSGGQRRLVIIDIFSRLNKQLYLFDEPESGLDPEIARMVMKKLQNLAQQGKQVIITSHQFQNINNDQFNLLFLKNGKIRFSGRPSEFIASQHADDLLDAYFKTNTLDID